ncbi:MULTISPECIES: type VI secretion system ATPase TssH [Caldimonas]|uniref:type VI secretion system ATPase TssH n=1 Tax=Caldimonas TaxID=196013 RepID=UPI00037BB401|nr:type VI secretion system ATPase TssH [Caldimonas manganoxidans]
MSVSLKTLITKLNELTRQAAERAANLCMAHGHHEVDIEHLLLALLDEPRSDLSLICARREVSAAGLRRDLESALRQLPSGNTRTPVFSQRLPQWLEHAWLIASLDSQVARIRSAHLLLALLTDPGLRQMAARASSALLRIPVEDLKHRLDELTAGSAEAAGIASSPVAASSPDGGAAACASTPALDRYTVNLTQRAREGQIDPVIGRESEIRQVIDILLRRRQNNPILTGEAGVGKTAVVEGLALRIASGDVPGPLRDVALHVLDLGLLQAGASVKGEFEHRLQQVIDEVKRNPQPIVLFIDEAHTLIGAGGQAGQNDAANLLKPALARGELRTVAATTWSEYKKYFEKDAALARRFQVVKVEEPSEAVAADMLRAMVPLMERHFDVRICDQAVTEAVRLSHRYITSRQLPDKAVGVLDTACARVALGRNATPAVIDEARRRLAALEAERQALQKEAAQGVDHRSRLAELDTQSQAIQARLEADLSRWEQEKALVAEIDELRERLERGADEAGAPSTPAALGAEPAPPAGKSRKKNEPLSLTPWQAALQAKLSELAVIQGDTPLVPVQVDAQVVAQIVSDWTGIPLGRMVKDDIQAVLQLQQALEERVIGQSHALAAIAQRVRTARAGLEDPNKPQGVFLFVGPSGVGKTETALALADALYGGERSLITINMSEYQEAHSVSGLKGSPPGYVGYGEGGVLTEAVRRKPYSVVLLDEVEKAHPDVLELFFQVFDKGVMEDAEGREIDFRNTLIILTSNVGSSTLMQACLNKDESERPSPERLEELLRPQLYKAFKPAFLGRLKVVPFYPLSDEVLERVIRLKLDRIGERFHAQHGARFEYGDDLVEAVLARCTEVDTGARNVDHLLGGSLLPELAQLVLARMAEGQAVGRIKASVGKDGQFKYRMT